MSRATPSSNRRQPQRLPPPIVWGPGPIDSDGILLDYTGEVGVALWKTVRAVQLWAELPEGGRAGAFDAGAHARRIALIERLELPAEVTAALGRAAAVLQPRARATTVARACRDLAEWAESESRLATAVELMQAAAAVLPADPEVAHEVGRLSRAHRDLPRAETWYRQAVARARRSRNWYVFARSYISLGMVSGRRGNFPQARRSLIRGLRAARRFSIRPLAANALHELVVLAIRADRPNDVARYLRAAIEAYGPGHPRLPALAHDFGVFLMKRGQFETALRTFQNCPADFGRPIDQLARSAATVRAAGSVGDMEAYAEAWARTETLLLDPLAGAGATTAHLAMARGALSAGELRRARTSAEKAKQLAEAAGEFAEQADVEAVLDSIAQAERAEAGFQTETGVPAPVEVRQAARALETAMAGLS